jgi:predicted nuclease of predicted toxin-antitoxin system
MKLIVDMNLSPRWIGLLTDAGIEAAHWSTLGAKNAPDSEIMAYAKVTDSVVLTHDLDFGAMLAATHGEKPSVVQIREEGALLTIDPNRTRLRVLPLQPRG